MSERNKDEEELIRLAEEFDKFLRLGPKIRFNLHKVLQEIRHKFEFIQANL